MHAYVRNALGRAEPRTSFHAECAEHAEPQRPFDDPAARALLSGSATSAALRERRRTAIELKRGALLTRVAPLLAVLAITAPRAAVAQDRTFELSGRVIDAATSAPIAGAVVRVDGAGIAIVETGENGEWRLRAVPGGRQRIIVQHVAYATEARELEPSTLGAREVTFRLDPRPVSLDALVVSASRRLERLGDAPVATELITRADVEGTGATDLASVLTERAGITLEGGTPAGAGIMLQGLGAERVLILLDGRPVVGRIGGNLDVSRLPTSIIERVEIVKGPQSTLYGSEAIGGVVNIITRHTAADSWNATARVTAGTEDRLDFNGTGRGSVGDFEMLADVGRRSIELAPGQADATGALSRRYDVLTKLGWDRGGATSAEGSVLVIDERQRWSSGQLYQFSDNRQLGVKLGGVWTRGAHRLEPTLSLSRFDHHSRSATSPDPLPGTGERETQELADAELLYSLDLGAPVVDAGVTLRRERIDSDRVQGAERVGVQTDAFVQTTLPAGRLTIVPGARYTTSERWGSHLAPRLALMYRPEPRLALRASVSGGYRTPNFKELYLEFLNSGPGFGYVVVGNPELEPETSRNFTAGIEWAGDRVYARTQLFHNTFDGFIESVAISDSAELQRFIYNNVEEGTTRGGELEAGAVWKGVRLEAGYAYLDAYDDDGAPLLGRPEHSGRASLTFTAPTGTRTTLSLVHTGATPVRREGDAVIERDAFTRLDLRLAQRVLGSADISLGAENVFQAVPTDWPGFTGRQLYVALEWGIGQTW